MPEAHPAEQRGQPTDHVTVLQHRIPHARVVAPKAMEKVAAGEPARAPAAIRLDPDASTEFKAVAEKVASLMATIGVPGAALGILASGREEHATFGVAGIESSGPIGAETRFQIGSLSKTFTATAIMRLVDEGRIELDAPVRRYVPGLKLADASVAERVTVRNLLTHTEGWWGEALFDTGDGDDAIARLVEELLPTFPQLVPLGVFYSYNNSGFILLGRILELVIGGTYRDAIEKLVVAPLRLAHSTFAPERDVPIAQGHVNEKGGVKIQEPLSVPRAVDPAGGLWSTTRDLLRYARFHLGDGERLLSQATLEAMQTPHVEIPGRVPGIASLSGGMNWMVQDIDGMRFVQHDGDTFAEHTEFLLAPERRFGFVLLTNSEPGGSLLAAAALPEALARYPGLEGAAGKAGLVAAISPSDSPTVELPAERMSEFTGRYNEPGTTLEVGETGGRLTLSLDHEPVPGQVVPNSLQTTLSEVPLAFAHEDVGRVGQTLVPFLRRQDGSVGWLSFGLRAYARDESAQRPARV